MSHSPQNPAADTTMSALVQHSLDGPRDLRLEQIPVPSPQSGEYLVRVGAAGVNFADVMQTYGTYVGGPTPPYTAGFEAAGEIVGVGAGVTSPLPMGTHVVGTGPGAFGQFMTMPSDEVIPVPSGWSDAEALGMILNWATALGALRTVGRVQKGETVLILAAAGGVGRAAIRLARHYGATVVAAASASKHAELAAAGADIIIDSRRPDLAAEVMQRTGGVDLVLESVGGATFSASMSVAKPFSGRVVVFGYSSGDTSLTTRQLVFEHHAQVMGLHIGALARHAPQDYARLIAELETLIVDDVYVPGNPVLHPLADGAVVLEQVGSGMTTGKHGLDPWR
ncbi:zinc-binding dehydrogenase [Microbacterium sp. NPDC056234]|uniref:zinc-binding dehydrogenase n=1 Tax=Microbacterium sp. NPDC056234 TaxID=3345757 RepID=UPI0035D90D34